MLKTAKRIICYEELSSRICVNDRETERRGRGDYALRRKMCTVDCLSTHTSALSPFRDRWLLEDFQAFKVCFRGLLAETYAPRREVLLLWMILL